MSRPEPWRLDASAYPFTADIRTRWADLDQLGHINNVAMAGLFEEGRIRFNRSLDLHHSGPDIRWLIAAVAINYLAEAHHPNDVTIVSGIGHIGSRSWTIQSAAFQSGVCVATCDATLVYTNAKGPAAFPETFREKFESVKVGS